MALSQTTAKTSEGYRDGALALFLSAGVILAALAFEHIGGYIPCPLCLQQRYAYYAGLPLLFISLVLLSAGSRKAAAATFFLVALMFLANAGLGVYQAGAEWKFWPGPDSCAGAQPVSTTAGGLLGEIAKTRVVRCDEAAWRMFGLSFAGWNVLTCLAIFILSLRAAFAAADKSK